MDALDAKATTTLRETAVEATPFCYLRILEFIRMNAQVFAQQSMHGKVIMMRTHSLEENKKVGCRCTRRGHSTEVEKLERRLRQQEQALSGFARKIEKQQAIGHAIQQHWTHVETILQQAEKLLKSKVGNLF